MREIKDTCPLLELEPGTKRPLISFDSAVQFEDVNIYLKSIAPYLARYPGLLVTYARDTQCPVLISYTALSAYAISSTNLVYGATRCPVPTLRDVRY